MKHVYVIAILILVIVYSGHSIQQNAYKITIEPDSSFPGWKDYDYSVESVKIYRKGFERCISVVIKNLGLCKATSAWGWYSPNGRSCWGEWDFEYNRSDVVDIKFRVGDSSPEPGATYRIELDGIYLGDVKIPATDSWYIVTVHNVSIKAGHHTLFLGTYQMDYYPDIHLDYIIIGSLKIEAEEYDRMGGNDPDPDLQGLTVYPRDIKLQIWDGKPGEGKLINETVIGKKQIVIDTEHEFEGNTYYASYLENNGTINLEIPWRPKGKMFHRIYVVVDPNDELKEINEDNNIASKLTCSIPILDRLLALAYPQFVMKII